MPIEKCVGQEARIRLDVRAPGGPVAATPRLVDVCLQFGVPLSVPERVVAEGLELDLRPGTIALIVGPSGSGKSLLLGAIGRQVPSSRMVGSITFPLDVSVLDAVAPAQSVYDAVAILTVCGLGEPMLWIRRFDQLSDGERFRARLARAISLHRRFRDRRPLLCDEFCAVLHRRLAKAIAFNLRKLVTRERLALVVATSHEDLEEDLQPDTVARLGGDEPAIERRGISDLRLQISDSRLQISDSGLQISDWRPLARQGAPLRVAAKRTGGKIRPATERMLSIMRRLRIEPGTVRDYRQFAGMHYRRRDQLGFVDKVFVAREVNGGKLIGIVVYGMPVLQLRLRNQVTGGRFVRSGRLLNREVRVLKRLVIHPDVRGCGLGHWLVRRTLPMVGVRFVECLAAMGAVHPVFDKAGMRRIGTVEPPAEQGQILNRLLAAGADPLAADFVTQVCRRPSVRRIVSEAVFEWYQSTTAGGQRRVERQTPAFLAQTYRQLAGSQPVYFIWATDEKGWQIISENTADREGGQTDVA